MCSSSIQDSGTLSNGETRYDFIYQGRGHCTIGQISTHELCDRQDPAAGILVVFLPELADLARIGANTLLSNRFKIPNVFWSSVAQDASGFFGCEDLRDFEGELENFCSYFRFLIKEPATTGSFPNMKLSYSWHKLGFFTVWTPLKGLVALCFGLPPSLKKQLLSSVRLELEDPFAIHTMLIGKIIELYDTSLWSWRDLIRNLEKHRTSPVDPQPDFITMHEIARHAIHSSETLAIAIETTTSLVREHEIFFEETGSYSTKSIAASKQTRRLLRSHVSLFKCLHLRSKALEERLKNEINLVVFQHWRKVIPVLTIWQALNTVAQHENRVAVQIGKASQTDSAAMKTISILGLVFLPGTFICAIFSTSFFNFSPGSSTEPQQWTVSEKFWVYWVVTIPLTLLTVACWIALQSPRTRYFSS